MPKINTFAFGHNNNNNNNNNSGVVKNKKYTVTLSIVTLFARCSRFWQGPTYLPTYLYLSEEMFPFLHGVYDNNNRPGYDSSPPRKPVSPITDDRYRCRGGGVSAGIIVHNKPGFDRHHNGADRDILFDVRRTVHVLFPQRRFIVPINDV